MPANHKTPHTADAKAKMSAARRGKPAIWKRRENHEVSGTTFWKCGRCHCFFAMDGFHSTKRTLLGIRSECKTCHRKIYVTSRNPDNYRLRKREHESRRRAAKAGVNALKYSKDDMMTLAAILGVICLRCGGKDAMQVDHVMPLSKGGVDHPVNFQPLCRRCNEWKQARDFDFRSGEQLQAVRATWPSEFKRLKP